MAFYICQVFLGGGRRNFIPDSMQDPEYPLMKGERNDGRDLTQVLMSNETSVENLESN